MVTLRPIVKAQHFGNVLKTAFTAAGVAGLGVAGFFVALSFFFGES